MRLIVWLLRAALFFTLFAFALNNQHEASVKLFFSQAWRAPMVFIVLAAFTLGCIVGGLAMAPSWWRHRKVAKRHEAAHEHLDAPAPVNPDRQARGAVSADPLDNTPSQHGV